MRAGLVLLSALASTSAAAFDVKVSDSGEPLRWGEQRLRFDLTLENGPVDVDMGAASAALRSAFETWGERLPETMAFEVSDLPGPVPLPNPVDGHNTVRWVEEDWEETWEAEALAIAAISYDSETGQITDADIVINAAKYRWVADQSALQGCQSAYDLQNVITHEVGHLLGLAHSASLPEATMFPTVAFCETKKRDLDSDDIAGASYLYFELGPIPLDEGGSFGCVIAPPRAHISPRVVVGVIIGCGLLLRRRNRRSLASVDGHVHGKPRCPGQECPDGAAT